MTDTDTTYNGWTNYPTWAVNLWLSNDEGLYYQALEYVGGACGDVKWLADTFHQWVRQDLSPDLGSPPSMACDLYDWALVSVDWQEIAAAWLEGVKDDS